VKKIDRSVAVTNIEGADGLAAAQTLLRAES
jgi:hypothetical protein